MIKLEQLSDNAVKYIRNELSQGGYLPERLLELDLEQGVVHTYVPIGFTPNSSTDYGDSLNYLTGELPSREIRDTVVGFIKDYLDDDERKYAIFETWREKGDQGILNYDLQHFFSHSRLYSFLRGSDKRKSIRKYLRKARAYPTIIILTSIAESSKIITNANEIDEEAYAKIVSNVDYLLIGAWDQEGYLIWRNN